MYQEINCYPCQFDVKVKVCESYIRDLEVQWISDIT